MKLEELTSKKEVKRARGLNNCGTAADVTMEFKKALRPYVFLR